MGNKTTVTVGAIAGAIASIGWWTASEFAGINAPEAIVASSVVVVTALLSFVLPTKTGG